MTVFRKINRLVRKSIIVYMRKSLFEQEDANGNEEKEVHLTRRREDDVILASKALFQVLQHRLHSWGGRQGKFCKNFQCSASDSGLR